MKKRKIIILIILIVIVISAYFIFFHKANNNSMENFKQRPTIGNMTFENRSSEKKSTTLSQTSEIKSASIEKLELHATYYLEETYVEANEYVKAGSKILKYTNGTYLVAPYNCCIVELSIPKTSGQCLNSHYVEIESTNILEVTMKIDESNIDNVKVGTEAKIEVTSLEKTYTGYITHIASTASNGKFEITIEFENDNNIKLGMTSTVSITI